MYLASLISLNSSSIPVPFLWIPVDSSPIPVESGPIPEESSPIPEEAGGFQRIPADSCRNGRGTVKYWSTTLFLLNIIVKQLLHLRYFWQNHFSHHPWKLDQHLHHVSRYNQTSIHPAHQNSQRRYHQGDRWWTHRSKLGYVACTDDVFPCAMRSRVICPQGDPTTKLRGGSHQTWQLEEEQ